MGQCPPAPSVVNMTHHTRNSSPPAQPAGPDRQSAAGPNAADPRTGRQKVATVVTLVYAWVLMILFGAIVLETFMVYPNVFADPPGSLELAMEFLAVTGPSDFFPPFGLATWVLGAAALLLTWRDRQARWWIVVSLAAIVGEGLASMAYFWPRNEIMFVEGLAVHSPEYLTQVAHEFEAWHWRSRMGFNAVAAVTAFVGFLRVYRLRWQPATTTRGTASVPAARR
jgi:hypothetical protein